MRLAERSTHSTATRGARAPSDEGGRPRRRFRHVALVVGALLTLLAWAGASPITAGASGGGDGCNPGRNGDSTTRWDGAGRDYSGIGGIWGTIKVYSPYVANWTSGWVMLWLDGSSVEHHVQAGWDEYPGGYRYIYFEWTYNNNGSWTRTDDNPQNPSNWINTTHNFTVLFNNPNSGEYTLYMDSGYPQKYYTYSDFTPNNGQAYGETHSAADQMAGGYNNHETFRSEQVWLPGSGWVWANLNAWSSNTSPGWYSYSKPNGSDEDIWDQKCSN